MIEPKAVVGLWIMDYGLWIILVIARSPVICYLSFAICHLSAMNSRNQNKRMLQAAIIIIDENMPDGFRGAVFFNQ